MTSSEVTPESIRLRKKILDSERERAAKKKKSVEALKTNAPYKGRCFILFILEYLLFLWTVFLRVTLY